jgi:hypothetical protein
MMQYGSYKKRRGVEEVLVDRNSALGINKFFEAPYQPDSRV